MAAADVVAAERGGRRAAEGRRALHAWKRRRLLPGAPWGYLVAAVVLLAAISVYPLVELVRIAFSNVGPTNLIGHWEWVGLANFRSVLANAELGQAVVTTVKLTLILLFFDLVVGFFVASVLVGRARSTNGVVSVMVFVWALPPLVSGSVWRFLLSDGGGVNSLLGLFGIAPVDWLGSPTLSLWSVGLITSWAALPFATILLRGAMLAVPRDVIEAAAMDGAGYWRIQTRVVLPFLRPTMVILAILAVIYSLQSFNFIFALTDGGPGSATANVPFLAYQMAFSSFDLSSGAAVALLALAFILLLAIPYTRSLRNEQPE